MELYLKCSIKTMQPQRFRVDCPPSLLGLCPEQAQYSWYTPGSPRSISSENSSVLQCGKMHVSLNPVNQRSPGKQRLKAGHKFLRACLHNKGQQIDCLTRTHNISGSLPNLLLHVYIISIN